MIPKTKERELATSEASRFYPIGLRTKPWATELSNSSIMTPTLYWIKNYLQGWFLIWDLQGWFFSKELLFIFISEAEDLLQGLSRRQDGNEDDWHEHLHRLSCTQFFIIERIPKCNEKYLRLGKSLKRLSRRSTISWPTIWGNYSSGYMARMLWLGQRGAVLTRTGCACPYI